MTVELFRRVGIVFVKKYMDTRMDVSWGIKSGRNFQLERVNSLKRRSHSSTRIISVEDIAYLTADQLFDRPDANENPGYRRSNIVPITFPRESPVIDRGFTRSRKDKRAGECRFHANLAKVLENLITSLSLSRVFREWFFTKIYYGFFTTIIFSFFSLWKLCKLKIHREFNIKCNLN